MSQTKEILTVQAKIEEWIIQLPLEGLRSSVNKDGVLFAETTRHAALDPVDKFLDRLAYTEDNIRRLHELYFYRREEEDEAMLRAEDVEKEHPTSPHFDPDREKRMVQTALAAMFSMRHDTDYFPRIHKYGTDLTANEELALQLITEVNTAIDAAYDALEKNIEPESVLRNICFQIYEAYRKSMAALAQTEDGGELKIQIEPMKWFENFLAQYGSALTKMVSEADREPGQEASRETRPKKLLH